MTRYSRTKVLATVLISTFVVGVGVLAHEVFLRPIRISVNFASAIGIYPGDDVRVLGVKVGRIAAIEPAGAHVRMTLEFDHDVPIPVDAEAIIVTQSLVAARYVQLTPAYGTTGSTMPDGAEIPLQRTAVPLEWDEVKAQLMRLATDLGPATSGEDTPLARFIDSTANAMQGNGAKLRHTLAELSALGRVLADGGGDIAEIIKGLHTFVDALRDSNVQIVEFQDRFAVLTGVLNDHRSSLGAALTDLSVAVGDIERFVGGAGDATAEQLQRLTEVTQILVDRKSDVENILHVTPNAIANGYNVYNPNSGAQVGAFVMNNFSDPVAFLCGSIAAVANVTSAETAKLCQQYLGPGLRQANFNYLPFPFNPYLGKAPDNLIYTDPALAPGGAGPVPPAAELPLPVSAHTGAIDNPFPAPGQAPPALIGPGPTAPHHLPAHPSPALYPGAPLPTLPTVVSNLPDLLLPAEGIR
ncbi:MCE family protein [Mycolicibacterium diernhoferi]|uniref:Mammalian cell entry protein n=1 Tax=Mycolicibacterium diernhoferi TaxID=1801 RepID=A0A1Q4HFV2_9MYCO|nr:MCE family protein [Mycolicibacterium diernhoferi]OJZ66420.1 mammalian cell entry protein [Mycolicibacterium diernhoferi]OPE56378.1 mammalian cell entry protein [Mycolicibacterium diernhoferi]PEG54220.1 mammalian cell entry protein [Mycolicibacterium diernhoferi]QYL24593.1 MCE family protein [Mycolicibacterium diernhoferi]